MIQLTRLPKPDYLAENHDEWLAQFLVEREENQGKRPPKRRYGHEKIRSVLHAISDGKCFYCERKLLKSDQKIDHHIDVALEPEKAFDWNNLYLACEHCNSKKRTEITIPLADCINPCGDIDPKEHLTFDDEFMRPLNDSTLGRNTIRKYQLNRGDIERLRLKELHKFERILRRIREKQIDKLTPSQRDKLLKYGRREHAYSLMFSAYLEEHVEID